MFKLLFSILIMFPTFAHGVELTENLAIKLYLDKNFEALASKYEIDLSEAQELTEGLWANPSLLADSQLNPFGKGWNQKNAGGPIQQDLIVTVPIDANGKRRQAVKVARLATKITEAQFLTFIREGVFNTLSTLYQLQKLRKEHELLEEKAQLFERLVLTLEKRIGSPNSQPLIQNRARLALEDVRLEIRKNTIDQVDTTNKLKVLLHQESDSIINPKVSFLSSSSKKFNLSELVENALLKRPDFIALKILKEQIEEQKKLDQRNIFDDISLQAGASRQSSVGARPNDPGSYRLPGAWSWLVGVTIPLPVFDRNQGEILRTKVREGQTLAREQFMVKAVTQDIDTSVKKLEITEMNLQHFKKGQLNNAKLVRDSALRQFGTGAMTLIEYLDAVDAYHTAISKYIESQYELTNEYQKLKLLAGQEIGP